MENFKNSLNKNKKNAKKIAGKKERMMVGFQKCDLLLMGIDFKGNINRPSAY